MGFHSVANNQIFDRSPNRLVPQLKAGNLIKARLHAFGEKQKHKHLFPIPISFFGWTTFDTMAEQDTITVSEYIEEQERLEKVAAASTFVAATS